MFIYMLRCSMCLPFTPMILSVLEFICFYTFSIVLLLSAALHVQCFLSSEVEIVSGQKRHRFSHSPRKEIKLVKGKDLAGQAIGPRLPI